MDEGKGFLAQVYSDLDIPKGHLRDLRSVHYEEVHKDEVHEEVESFTVVLTTNLGFQVLYNLNPVLFKTG